MTAYALIFRMDWCGSASREHWFGEAQEITLLNRDLQWWKTSAQKSEKSPKAGRGGRHLSFSDLDALENYLLSIKFMRALARASALAEWGRDIGDIDIVEVHQGKIVQGWQYGNLSPKAVSARDLICDRCGKEVWDLLEQQAEALKVA
jgi:hypothetical protein